MDDKIDERAIDYINKELKKGFAEEQIRDVLVKAGHAPENVDHYFAYSQKLKGKKIFISIFVIFILLGTVFSFVLYLDYLNVSKRLNKLVIKGSILCGQGNYDEAMKKFEQGIQLNSTSSKGYGYKGWCLLEQGAYDEAITELKKAQYQSRIYQPGYRNPNFHYILGTAYCGKGDYRQGIEQLDIAIKLNYSNPDFYNSLGDCYMNKGDNESANKQYNISRQLEQNGEINKK